MDKVRVLLEDMTPKKVGYIILGLLMGSLLLFSIFSSNSNSNVDSYPIEGSDQDYSTRARLINSEELFKQLSGDRRYDAVSEDLYVFAKTGYSVYKDNTPDVIGFVLAGSSQKEGSTVSFTGNYGAIKNKITVTVTILGNDRITTSITDTKTKLNIDSKLPSNKKINKYISELPKTGENYVAEYARSSDSITIYLNERKPELLDKAIADIRTYIDDGSYDDDRVEVLFPPDSLGK